MSTGIDPLATLTPFQARLILSVYPAGARIVAASPVRTWLLPCPVRVEVARPAGGATQTLILRLDRHLAGVAHEGRLLPVLARLGLPVPAVLAGPAVDPADPTGAAACLLSLLPGLDLLAWCWSVAPPEREAAGDLALAAVARLQALTPALMREPMAAQLPRRSLLDELRLALASGGPWDDDRVLAAAVRGVLPLAAGVSTPLVFSNGDYNPGNFMTDGRQITGFLDFAWACLADPHIGLVRYLTYGWLPFDGAAVVERYRRALGLSEHDIALRLAIHCLRDLANTAEGEQPPAQRVQLLGYLRQALSVLV